MDHDSDNGFDYLSLDGFMLKATSTEDIKQFNPQITQIYIRIHTQL